MNKHGQSLVVFILILPLIVLFFMYIIDVGLTSVRVNRLRGVLLNNIQISLDNDIRDIDRISEIIRQNESDIILDVSIVDDELIVKLVDTKKNLFGKMNVNNELNYCGNYIDKKINEKCGE